VRTRKEREQARDAHTLESAKREVSEQTKRKRRSGTYILESAQREWHVRTRKECEQARDAHILESAKRDASEETERKRRSGTYILESAKRE
jgi:hypothetical protein